MGHDPPQETMPPNPPRGTAPFIRASSVFCLCKPGAHVFAFVNRPGVVLADLQRRRIDRRVSRLNGGTGTAPRPLAEPSLVGDEPAKVGKPINPLPGARTVRRPDPNRPFPPRLVSLILRRVVAASAGGLLPRPRLGGGGGPFIALSPYNNWDAYANLALGGGVRVSATDSCASVLYVWSVRRRLVMAVRRRDAVASLEAHDSAEMSVVALMSVCCLGFFLLLVCYMSLARLYCCSRPAAATAAHGVF